MSEDTIEVAIIIGFILVLLIVSVFSFRKREDAWVEIAKTQFRKSKKQEYNTLCEVLKPFWSKEVKVHGMLFERIYDVKRQGRDWILDAFIIMASSKEIVPVSIGDIKVKTSESFFKKKLEGHSREYFEFKGVFSEQECNGEKNINFELISARKLSRTERKRIQQMN